MYCISINYKKAGLEIRKKLAFSRDRQEDFLKALLKNKICQGVIISTCNRTEVYFCGNEIQTVLDLLSEFSYIPSSELSSYVMSFKEQAAVRHLFKVACGIDSMVVGEDEILGQTKTAYALAADVGTTGYEMNIVFQRAIACAKKIKTETALSRSSVSTATLAAKLAAGLGKKTDVLVIGGTGKIGSTVIKNLLSYGYINVFATSRNHGLNWGFSGNYNNLSVVDYKERYVYADKADCVISATSSPHFTITASRLKDSLTVQKKRLFIDLAVPQDIDRQVSEILDLELVDIDYFQHLAEANNKVKLDSVENAKEIIEEEIDTLYKDLIYHSFLPDFNCVKERIEDKNFESLVFHLKSELSYQEFKAVLKSFKSF